MKKWKINSWRNFPVKHIPEYPDKKELDQVHIAVMEGYEFVIFCLDRGEDKLEIDSRSGKIHDISPDFPSEVLEQISLSVSGFKN